MGLPDKRLERVLDKFIDRIKTRQSLSMRKLAHSRTEEIQFGRFLSNERVRVSSMEERLYEQCHQSVAAQSHVLLLEDTSQMAFSLKRAIEGLGKVDKGLVQGFYLHPVLALDAATGACQGVAALEFGLRSLADDGLRYAQRQAALDRIAFEDKESYRWQRSIQTALAHLPPTATKTVVADRESDIYAVLVGLGQLGVEYLIRSRQNRTLTDGGKLYERVASWPVVETYEVALPPTDQRSAHVARLRVRMGQVSLKKTAAKTLQPLPAEHSSWVVAVGEDPQTTRPGEPPIDWVLLTSHQVPSPERARELIGYYQQRWNVEQLFRSLKTKCLRFESSQLSSYEKLRKLMMVALMGAVKVLQLVRARAGGTAQELGVVFAPQEAAFVQALSPSLEGKTDLLKNPHPPQSLAFGAWVIARLAGWSGYQSQRPAGPTDFFTGLQRFYERWQGYLLALHLQKDVLIL